MTVKEVKSYDDFKQIINSGKVSVFDFWATWCGPCRAISPIFEKHSGSADYSDIDFYKVDVDEQPEIAEEVGIRAMPTFMAFKNGTKLNEFVGASPPGLETMLVKAKEL